MLSSEILLDIFSLLPKSDLYTCLFVSYSWFHSAAHSYYHTIRIKDTRNHLIHFRDHILNSSLLISHFIKHIQIDSDSPIKDTTKNKQAFQDILSLCSNLKELTMSKNTIYWQYLYEASNSVQLVRLSSTGRETYCDEVYYYRASHKFSSTITELEIHRSCDDSIYQTYHHLFDYLSNFTALRSLSIASGSQKHIIHLDQLLRTCSHLKSLNFQIDHPFVETGPDEAAYPSMHVLDIFSANFSITSLQYIIRRFINLKRFTLRINQTEQQPELSQFFRDQFVPFIQSLEYASLQFQIIGRSTLECNMNFLSKIYYTTHARFNVHDGRAERTQIGMIKEKESLSMDLVFVRNLTAQQSESTPYSSYLQTFGYSIVRLSITYSTYLNYNEAANLNSILDACPHLQHLAIHMDQPPLAYISGENSVHSHYPPAQLTYGKSSLTHLSLSCMTITQAFLYALVRFHPRISELSFINCLPEIDEQSDYCSFDLTSLEDLAWFSFDIMAYRRIKRQPNICVIVDLNNKRHYYLALPHQSSIDIFTSISEKEFNKQEKIHIINLKFSGLKKLELKAGKNQACSRVVKF